MKRRIFNVLVAVSLLLCIAAVALWVRSYWVSDYVSYSDDSQYLDVMLRPGALHFAQADSGGGLGWRYAAYSAQRIEIDLGPDSELSRNWAFLGFVWQTISDGTRPFEGHTVMFTGGSEALIPFWMIAAPLVVLPVIWVRNRLTRRGPIGHCPTCNYDLRATPERCPECGTFGETRNAE